MALSTELYGLKASGTYRFERDQSITLDTVEPLENVRMLVGFSKKGPFNTPVFISNTREFLDIFGNIDRSLESRGAYFHRSCLAALSAGPIYALNLLKLEDGDVVDAMEFSTSTAFDGQTLFDKAPYKGMYNIDTFYTPSEKAFLDNLIKIDGGDEENNHRIFNLTNISQSPISVIVTKVSDYNATNFKVTAQEWYGKGNVPEWMNESSLISDFMVDVYVFKGNWGADPMGGATEGYDYSRLASDIKYSKYYDKNNGFKRRLKSTDTTDTSLTQFMNEPDVITLGKYTGSLIPGFVDKNGRNIYIEYLINSDTATTGLFCTVNEQAFAYTDAYTLDGMANGIDLVGHNLPAVENVCSPFLSYNLNPTGGSSDDANVIEPETIAGVEFGLEYKINKTDETTIAAKDNEFFIKKTFNSNSEQTDDSTKINLDNLVVSYNENSESRLTRVLSKVTVWVNDEEYVKIACQDTVDQATASDFKLYKEVTEYFSYYQVYALKGFKLTEDHLPNGKNDKQHEILSLLEEDSTDSNLYNALIDRELIQFRYLVDTFGLGIEESCKDAYTKLCAGRKSALAIINAPSCNDFKKSVNPSFTLENGAVSSELIAKGGDSKKSPSFYFTLPDQAHGASYGAYYYPYVKVYSNSTTLNIPPAAYISNLYVAKYGDGKVWMAVAGQNRGVISGNGVVGVESTLIRDNREWLEPAGINPIVYTNGVGVVVYANKTAKQTPKSALSEINCRECCIFIQDRIERILRNYLFEVNNAQTRLEIKTLVDNMLSSVKAQGGIYDFKTVMDNSNNDSEVIDHNMGVIDVYIEPSRLMDILVQRLTILRTGVIESGSFESL